MMHQTFSQEPFLVSGLHGDQILGARSNQQDSFSILAGEDILVLVLADGMGGYTGGELASRAAVEGCLRAFERKSGLPGERMRAAVTAANEQVWSARKKRGEDDEMGTTLVAAWIGGWAEVGQRGDSFCCLSGKKNVCLMSCTSIPRNWSAWRMKGSSAGRGL
ncbi:MAG: PP2C family protein-serine/threonine phosphatase [Akkermansia muciniphila]